MRWTIKRKLFLGFGFAAILLVGSVGVARWAQSRSQFTQNKIIETYGLNKDLEHLDGDCQRVNALERGYLITGNEQAMAKVPAVRQEVSNIMARVEPTLRDNPEQMARWRRWMDDLAVRKSELARAVTMRRERGFDAAAMIEHINSGDRAFAAMQGNLDEMKDAAAAQLNSQLAENEQFQRKVTWVEGGSLLAALMLLTAIALTLARSVNRNVQIAVAMVGAMAEKDLSGEDGEAASNDELAVAIVAINRMKQSMTGALSEVAHSSAQVAAAGAQIESSAKQIAETTHAEMSSVEQFASSLAEMNATVKEVAEHAERASGAASEAVGSASHGRDLVRETRTAMSRMHETVHAASNDITTLGREAQSIGEVVRIIQEIAEQTNLLALNAAIEAARAGEQGKGFAVVAQEVRQLAERTAKFTHEIAGKVDSVQQGAGRAVKSMQQGEAVVNEGVSQFNKVGTALEEIVERIDSAQQGIAMIATATTQQSAATGGLTESIHRISSEVNQTATQVDQTALACAEVAKLASELQAVVDGFRLPAAIPDGSWSQMRTPKPMTAGVGTVVRPALRT
jgi:methyl-accepting chemotaxis protein